MYIQSHRSAAAAEFSGESFYTLTSTFGATFTYYLKEELKTKKAKRMRLSARRTAVAPR